MVERDRLPDLLTLGLPEEGGEAGLLEVPIVGERNADVSLLHDEEARAVRQAPPLVGPGGVALDGSTEPGLCLRDDLDTWVVLEALDHLGRKSPTELSHARHGVERLDEDEPRCYERSGSQRVRCSECAFMQPIPGVPERDPVARVGEDQPLA